MKKRISVALALTAFSIIGCGGGGSSTDSTLPESVDTDITDTITTGGSYSACVKKTDAPTFVCLPTCSDTEYTLNTYNSVEECELEASGWIADFNKNDAPSTTEQEDALGHINTIREGIGLARFKYSAILERATANHENYMGDAQSLYNVNVTHYEYQTEYPSDFFTGALPTDRAIYEGYDGEYAGDVISYGDRTVAESLDELMSAIYHRQALLWSNSNELGIGGVERNFDNFPTQPHLMGIKTSRASFLKAIASKVLAYPYDGETNVRRVFYEESPDPLPNTSMSGNPISVEFNIANSSRVTLSRFKLFDETNTEITDVIHMDKNTDPNLRFTENQFALFPLEVLKSDHTYRVEISYSIDSVANTKTWHFTTRGEMTPR